MSKRRDLQRHLQSLVEIKEIMNAMKNLALMEIHKVARRLETQHRVVESIGTAASDFLSFHRYPPGGEEPARDVYLLLGSERGFCGDFNEALSEAFRAHDKPDGDPVLVTIGNKLSSRFTDDSRVIARLPGPSALEEIEAVLLNLMATLEAWQATQRPTGGLRLTMFHHRPEEPGVKTTRLDPFSEWAPPPRRAAYPPLLNLEPRLYLAKLAEHYLFSVLHELFYCSLMAENQQRVQRMDFAVRRLDDKSEELLRQFNSVRQEEITEEIELIMLNVETPVVAR